MQPIRRSQFVFQIVPATFGPGTLQFPDVPELRTGVEVVGIEAYTSTQLAATTSGVAMVTAGDAVKVALTLVDASTELIREIPLVSLISANNGGLWKEFVPFLVNWQRSKIAVTQAFAAATPSAVGISVFFRKLTDRK